MKIFKRIAFTSILSISTLVVVLAISTQNYAAIAGAIVAFFAWDWSNRFK